MRIEWAVQLDPSKAIAASRLRLHPGVEVCVQDDAVWLRGQQWEEYIERELRKLPAMERYRVRADGKLTRVGTRVPKGRLPDGEWHSLAEWIVPRPQTAALPGESADNVPVRLVRSDRCREPSILRSRIESWAAYAARAPRIRLARLTFAMNATGEVIIRGRPLPPHARPPVLR